MVVVERGSLVSVSGQSSFFLLCSFLSHSVTTYVFWDHLPAGDSIYQTTTDQVITCNQAKCLGLLTKTSSILIIGESNHFTERIVISIAENGSSLVVGRAARNKKKQRTSRYIASTRISLF